MTPTRFLQLSSQSASKPLTGMNAMLQKLKQKYITIRIKLRLERSTHLHAEAKAVLQGQNLSSSSRALQSSEVAVDRQEPMVLQR